MSSTTTAISLVIAVVLFTVATLIEGERPEPELLPEERTPQMITQVRRDTQIRDERAVKPCTDAEAELRASVEAAQVCEVDEDCTIFDYGYPIQCMTAVAQSEISSLREQYREYDQSCSYRVYYDCPAEPLQRHPVCRNNRCTVELRTLDLKELTFDHIGVDPDSPIRSRPGNRQ